MSRFAKFEGSLRVLLVEDNPIDIFMTRHALEETGLDIRLDVAEDGQSAIDFLYTNCLPDESGPCPHLIIPDINLPKKSGKEVLAEIKRHPDTLRIPVIMFTGSDDPRDICEACRLHANCYVTKPNDMDQFKATIQSIQEFRTKISQLPQEDE